MEIRKEKAMKAKNPSKLTCGISIHWVERPEKAKLVTLNPGTTRVTR